MNRCVLHNRSYCPATGCAPSPAWDVPVISTVEGVTPRQAAILVIHHINELFYDGVAGQAVCCPDCCEPCGALRELLRAGILTAVVKNAPPHLWGDDWAWWSNGAVNSAYFYRAWGCTSCPPCETALNPPTTEL